MRKLFPCLVAVLVLASCGASEPQDEADPPDVDVQGVWVLRSGHGPSGEIEPAVRADITLEVEGDKLRGSGGCNTYGGAVVIAGTSFDPGGLAVSEVGCPGPLVEPETRYLEAIEAVDTAAVDGQKLTLTGPETELVFRRVPPVDPDPLTGTVWTLESLVEGPALSSAVASALPARLVLEDDGTFEGTTGCREFTGEWTVSGDVVEVTQLVLGSECNRARDQDSHVASILGSGFRAEVDGKRLTLTAEGGGLGLVYRSR